MAYEADGAVTPAAVDSHVRAWLAEFVVGLNLCPFARPLLSANNLRIEICENTGLQGCARSFLKELNRLQSLSENELATTLLVFTSQLDSFKAYLEFLDLAQALLEEAGLEGVVQLASFHPHYQFAGEDSEAPGNYSNRSPYPIIHLLREEMLSRVLADELDAEQIPQRNIATLEQLGRDQLEQRWHQLFN